MWKTLWTWLACPALARGPASPAAGTGVARERTDHHPADRARRRRARSPLAAAGRGPAGQPAGLADREQTGDAAREHRDRGRARRLHTLPAGEQAAAPA